MCVLFANKWPALHVLIGHAKKVFMFFYFNLLNKIWKSRYGIGLDMIIERCVLYSQEKCICTEKRKIKNRQVQVFALRPGVGETFCVL